MTFEVLSNLMEKHNIPKDVQLLSDSGWECYETEMDGVFYNKEENQIVFTQSGNIYDKWSEKDGWVCIHGQIVDFVEKHGIYPTT